MTRWRTFYAIRQHDHLARVCVVEVYKDAPSRRRQPGTPRQFEDQMTASRAIRSPRRRRPTARAAQRCSRPWAG